MAHALGTFRLDVGRLGHINMMAEPTVACLALAGLVFLPIFGSFAALLFLASGGVLVTLRPRETIDLLLRVWPVLMLVLFCTASAIWSREPMLTARFGLQLCATALVTVALCSRLAPRDFCVALFALLGLSMLASLGFGTIRSDGAWTGIYGSKNAFAGAAATFTVLGFGVASVRDFRPLTRGLALAMAAAGFGLVVLAQSVGALVFLAATLLLFLAIVLIARAGFMTRSAILAIVGLAAGLAALVISAEFDRLSALILDETGKDLTLTGRTELWAVALSLIGERPVLGVGYQAFWVIGNAEAEALWFMFAIESRSGFNFHNMYLSNAVEIGVLGAAIQIYLLYAATFLAGIWTIRTGSAVPAMLFALAAMAIMASFIEVPLFFQFSLRTVLIFAIYTYAREALARTP